MGRRISIETARQLCKTQANDSIFNRDNPYGYKINVNHPEIRPLYEKYKEKTGHSILSDSERRQFEAVIFRMIERKKNEHK